jgi:hypothetical protein
VKVKGQNGVTGASPPTVISMGGSLYLGRLSPREMSLAIWGFERQGVKGSRKVFPFTDYRQEDSQNEGIPQNRHMFARQGNNKTNACK